MNQGLGGYILVLQDILTVVVKADKVAAVHVVVLVHVEVEAARGSDTKDLTAFVLEAHLHTSAHGSLDFKTIRLPKKWQSIIIF